MVCKAKVDEAEGQKAAMDDHVRTLKVSIESYSLNEILNYTKFIFNSSIFHLFIFIFMLIFFKYFFIKSH